MSIASLLARIRPHHQRILAPVLIATFTTIAGAAPSSPPLQQVPGYYHQTIGQLQVTALFDGVVALPRQQIKGISARRVDALTAHRYVPESDKGMQTAVNAYLVRRNDQLLLVDAGTANCFGKGLGHVHEHLRQAGYKPEDVDAVLLTHAHPDHACGLLDAQGSMAFPNATVWIAAPEARYWDNAEAEKSAPAAMRPLFGMAHRALAPYAAAGKLRYFGASDTLPAGVSAIASHGHTPGHTSYLIDGGKGAHLLVWGDVLHYHAVQFAAPQASFEVDTDRAQAIASRRDLLARSARQGWWVAGAHLPFPGLGHVRTEGKAFAWVPMEFSPLPDPSDAH